MYGTDQEAGLVKYKIEVIADQTGQWTGNGLRFESYEEAQVYAIDLQARWTAVRDWRVVAEEVSVD